MKILIVTSLLLLNVCRPLNLFAQEKLKYNVLFIAIDDLNDWVGPLDGYKGVKTPNIDRLATQGMNFTRAYCPAPVCNPSRTALLTGVRPSTSGVYQNWHPWRRALPNAITTKRTLIT